MEDIYRIQLESKGLLRARLSTMDAADLDLLLMDSHLEILARAAGPSADEALDIELPAGTYFLMVSQFGSPQPSSPDVPYHLTVRSLDHAFLFPNYGEGEGIASTIWALNPSRDESVDGLLERRDSDGLLHGGDAGEDISVSPLGVYRRVFSGEGGLVTGSARLSADRALGAALLFEGGFGVAGVPASSAETRFLVPIETSPETQVRTGVALFNPNSETTIFTIALLGKDGAPLDGASAEMSLTARGQIARFADELFEAGADFEGSLFVSSAQPLAGMAIRTTPGEFATLPVAAVPGEEGASARQESLTLSLPRWASGPGIVTTLVVVNPFGGDFGVAGVPSAAPLDDFLLPIEMNQEKGIRTGLAVVNAGEATVTLTLTLRDPADESVAVAESQLQPSAQLARFPDEIFDSAQVDLSTFIGVLEVAAKQSVSAVAIRVSPQQFATMPVTPAVKP